MHFKPPEQFSGRLLSNTVFLAGSIAMGEAEQWQEKAAAELEAMGYTIFNPRRDNWDPSWEQSINNPQFREQVEWELNGLKRAEMILFYFQPGTPAPVTLLEFGLYAASGKQLVVACPEGFWRKGNVDIVCERYGLEVFPTLEDAIASFNPEGP